MRQDLQNNPFIFWTLAAIAVGSLLFAVYTFQITKPSREIYYRVYSKKFDVPDILASKLSLSTVDGPFTPSSGYVQEINIWNNGNLEVDQSYILQPIRIKFDESMKILEVLSKNIGTTSFNHKLSGQYLELSFERLLAKAGIVIRFYSAEKPSFPQIEGLISDPIRGAVPLKVATFLPYDITEKDVGFFSRLIAVLVPAFGVLGMLSGYKSIRPQRRLFRIPLDLFTFVVISGASVFVLSEVFNLVLANPPF